ncbi:MAG: C25 family cysteine peptidase, partial [Candidatus Eiseniibacteriota bacterium]
VVGTLGVGPMRRSLAVGGCLSAAVALFVSHAAAQGSGGSAWVSLDGSPTGTRAQVVVNTDLSNRSQTWLDVTISGFFVTTRVGTDGRTYQDLNVPGLPSMSAPGEPRLPIVRADLALSTDAIQATPLPPVVFDLRSLSGYLVWPSPIPGQVHDGTPAQFTRDEATYGSTAGFPLGGGVGGPRRNALGGIPASMCTAYPLHWNPASGVLEVAARTRFGFGHPGGLSTPTGLSKEHSDAAGNTFPNWDVVLPDYTVNWSQYEGAFLFVCPSEWMSTIQPLITEKKTRGFAVKVINVPLSGETCPQLRQAIKNWYLATPQGADHYCLLVGGSGSTPFCSDVFSQLSDKTLSSVDGDLEPEIYMGRVYVGNTADLQNQVKKILDYEIGGQVNNDGNVLLVAHHQEDDTFTFPSYQGDVQGATYAQVTPVFTTVYGNNPAVGNGDIANAINSGVGVVSYIGHGDPAQWLHWSFSDVSFAYADANNLANFSLTPVVWSIACQTADPRVGQNLANGFMRKVQGGAVAFYGAVDQTFGPVTSVLNDSLFQAVYGRGIVRHGLAISYGEHAAMAADSLFGFDAINKYVLYGDPEMEIKRANFGGPWVPIDLLTPINVITPCPGVDCCPSCPPPMVDLQVVSVGGAPVPNVKVGIWKPRIDGTDQVLANRYTGPDGWAHIPAPGMTAGTLYVGFDDGVGRAGLDSISVQALITGVENTPPLAPLRLSAAPNVTSASTRISFGRPLTAPAILRFYRADGRLVRALRVPSGARSVDWDGKDEAGKSAAAGVYFAGFDSREARLQTRIVLVR